MSVRPDKRVGEFTLPLPFKYRASGVTVRRVAPNALFVTDDPARGVGLGVAGRSDGPLRHHRLWA